MVFLAGVGLLGTYLRELRTRLDPVAFGYTGDRRRTPGLRREEVAQRAGMSPTWYSWLEQGRGGPPSAKSLERLVEALRLSEAEREHLFILGLGRPPETRYRSSTGVTPRLQRMIDAMDVSPVIIRTATWDVVAWNWAAASLLTDYGALPSTERNLLRVLFLDPRSRAADYDWEGVARVIVGVFRGDVARASASAVAQPLVDELCEKSLDFAAMWQDNTVYGSCEGIKRIFRPELGEVALEFSALTIDGRPDLAMLVYTPVSSQDAVRIREFQRANDERSY